MQGRGIDHGEIELRLGSAELVEQLERLVDNPPCARPGAIDFVHDDDRLQAQRQRFSRDEACLRHRSVDGVDQQQHAVDHRQNALDLAAEVGVTRRVDDVDVRIAIFDRAVLGDDGDPAFALEVVAVHHPLEDVLVRRERARLHQQLVDQGRLAMIDVGDDRDVAKLTCGGHGALRDENRLFYLLRKGAAKNISQNPVFRL